MNVKPNMNYLPSLFLFPFFISISFNRLIVYISFAQILFCFRVTLQSYFPLIDILHFVLSPQTYSFPWHRPIWFLLNCQSIYSLVWTKIYIQVLQGQTRIRHFVYKLSLRFCLWSFFVYIEDNSYTNWSLYDLTWPLNRTTWRPCILTFTSGSKAIIEYY